MKDQSKIYGPETPNYALLNQAAKGMSAAEHQASKRLTSKSKKKTAQSPRHEQDPSK